MQLIRSQAQILVEVLESFAAWEKSKYCRVLRIVNTETLELLRTFIGKYADESKDTEHSGQMLTGANEVVRKQSAKSAHFNSLLNRSFGLLASEADGSGLARRTTQQFWKSGFTDPRDVYDCSLANPLFALSGLAGSKFAVSSLLEPLAIYHLSLFPDMMCPTPGPFP